MMSIDFVRARSKLGLLELIAIVAWTLWGCSLAGESVIFVWFAAALIANEFVQLVNAK